MSEEKKIAVPINPKHNPAAIDCPYCEYVVWIEQDTTGGQCRWCKRSFTVFRDKQAFAALFALEACTHCEKLATHKVSGWIDYEDAGEGWQLVCEDHLKEFQEWDFMEKDTLHGFSALTDVEQFKIVGPPEETDDT